MKTSTQKILKGAVIAFLGAGLTALISYLGDLNYVYTIQGEEVDLTLAVGALLSVVVNTIRKMYPGLLGAIRK